MGMSRKWLIVGVLALLCIVSLVGLVLSLSSPHQPPSGAPSLSVDVRLIPQVLPAAAKAYSSGSQMFATTTITNTGDDPIRNFHIDYRIPGYVEAAGQEDYPLILPGQTVVDWCYPTFPGKKMKAINSPADAELDVSYAYDGSNGPKGTSKRFTLLKHNDWIWSYLPKADQLDYFDGFSNGYLLAAWVTKDDPAINQLAKRLINGISTDSDAGAYNAALYIWYGLQRSGLDYVSEPATFWNDSGIQTVTFPSETLQNGGGNCVDISVLFCSLLEAVGVRTKLILSTGHCQFAFILPESGTEVPVEETAVGVWKFERAIADAQRSTGEQALQGTYIPIDVQDTWAVGMVPAW